MSFTMDGTGTWYYGKDNSSTYTDICAHCSRHVTLSSYDTREWLVLFYIPVFPLGKKRIMDSCPACTKHRHLPLKKYRRNKKQAYEEAEQNYNNNPNDIETAGQLLQVYAAYQDMDLFDEMAPHILHHFPDDHKMLNTVGIIHFQYGRLEPASDCLEQSLLLHDDDEIRYILGFIYARLAEPDTAALYFQFILDNAVREKAPALFTVVDAYQAQGRHQEALTWLDHLLTLDPDVERNKVFTKSKKLSEKHQLTGKPLKAKQIQPAQKAKTPFSGKTAWCIAAAIWLLIGSIFPVISLYRARRAAVYLVNGLDRPYEVAIGGQTYMLSNHAYRKITVPEGDIVLTVNDPDLQIDSSMIQLRSSFWTRPFSNRVYVVNPDGIALIEWIKVYYHENTYRARQPEWEMYYGEHLYLFDDVQCAFKPLPERISSSTVGSESRVQIKLFDRSDVSPDYIPYLIEHLYGFEEKIKYLKKIIYYEPDNYFNLHAFYAAADAGTFTETVRPGLDAVPVRMDWHRLYQTAIDISQPDYDLAVEYKERLAKLPDDAGMQYLYGRVLNEDRQNARYWFERAIQNPKPSAYGHYALGFEAMSSADFQTALEHFYAAMCLNPQHPFFCDFYFDMLIATEQLDIAEEYCKTKMPQITKDYAWMQRYVYVLKRQDKYSEVDQVFEQWCSRNKDVYSEEDFVVLRKSDRMNTAYLKGDYNALQEIIGEPNDVADNLLLTLCGKKPVSHALIASADSFPPMWLLLCYISEFRLGNGQDAALFLSEASKRFQQGNYEQRYIARCLESEVELDPEKICGLVMETELKAVTLTALSIRFPEHRDRFYELAQRLNYKRAFPYHFLNTVFQDAMQQNSSSVFNKNNQAS